jgi:hypothetical protein
VNGVPSDDAVAFDASELVSLPPTAAGGRLQVVRQRGPSKEQQRRAKFLQSGGADAPEGAAEQGADGDARRQRSQNGASTSGRRQEGNGGALAAAGKRITAADKTQLSSEQAEEIARRLRAPAAAAASARGGLIRVYRYAVDDLRLLKALDDAKLEGRVVVVDTVETADIVIAARRKRTGKQSDPTAVRNAAAARGIPFAELPVVSGRRVAEALAPLLGPAAAAAAAAAARAAAPPGNWDAAGGGGGGGGGGGDGPRLISGAELDAGGGNQLMQLLWSGNGGNDTQQQIVMAGGSLSGGGGGEPLARRAARLGDPWEFLAVVDAEDDRSDAVPPNPFARAAAKYQVRRPMRHGSRIQRRKLAKDLAEQNPDVDW